MSPSMVSGPAPDVVVVGGGILGTAAAYHLAASGRCSVMVLDREHVAAGATGMSSALVRIHYPNAAEARLAQYSLEVFADWSARIGGTCGYTPTGFLRIVGEHDADRLARNVEMLRRIGGDVTLLSPDEVHELQPMLATTGMGGAAYEPAGGYADGSLAAGAFAAAARGYGAQIKQGVTVTGIGVSADRVTGVETTQGFVPAGAVVMAAGVWSAPMLAEAGVELALRSMLIRVGLIEPPAAARGHMTMIDNSLGTYFRPDARGRTEVGLRYALDVDADVKASHVDEELITDVITQLLPRVPAFADAGVVRGWGGVDVRSADGAVIAGAWPGLDGLHLATGASGTGFKIAPAVGAGVAAGILGEASPVDLTPFRPTRFAEDDPVTSDTDYRPPKWRYAPLSTVREDG